MAHDFNEARCELLDCVSLPNPNPLTTLRLVLDTGKVLAGCRPCLREINLHRAELGLKRVVVKG